jgi:hypothetical protein
MTDDTAWSRLFLSDDGFRRRAPAFGPPAVSQAKCPSNSQPQKIGTPKTLSGCVTTFSTKIKIKTKDQNQGGQDKTYHGTGRHETARHYYYDYFDALLDADDEQGDSWEVQIGIGRLTDCA